MVSITLYGGVSEVGGNKILVEDKDTRLMLDFGRRMGEAGKFYEEFIQVRSKCALLDLLKLGIIPKLNGIYPNHLLDRTYLFNEDIDPTSKLPMDKAEDYWKFDEIIPYDSDKPGVNAVFISHAHFDHIQDLSFVHKDIPIYCTETTKVLAKAINDVSMSGVEYQFYELDDYNKISIECKSEHFKTIFAGELETKKVKDKLEVIEPKSGYTFTKESSKVIRNYLTTKETEIGSLSMNIIPVDHSVPGASSALINTSEGKRILYTGDIRFHGDGEYSIEAYLKELGNSEIDILICEGTRIDSKSKLTEIDVFDNISEQVRGINGLILVDFGWKDTTRFATFEKIAKDIGRTFVINPKIAYLLYELYSNFPENYKDPTKMDHIKVYKKRQEDCLYSNLDYDKFKAGYLSNWGRNKSKDDNNLVRIAEKLGIGGDPGIPKEELTDVEKRTWELSTHHIYNGISAYEIRETPEKYIMMFSFWDANELFDLSNLEGKLNGAKYIRASCEPFSDEMEIDEGKLMNWLDKFGIDYERSAKNFDHFRRAHVSGHASRPELKELIEKINPGVLIPIHTQNPEAFQDLVSEIGSDTKVQIPEIGVKYSF
jgi:ribonuclease J